MSFELALPCHLPDPGVLPTKNIVTNYSSGYPAKKIGRISGATLDWIE